MLNGPRIEVVAIGNELLKGITVNSNAAEISQALSKAGFHCYRHTVLPDGEDLKPALQECLQRSQIVITTGGLGPTCDDTTRQAAAEIFGSSMVLDQTLAADLKKRYGDLPISLQNQATVPIKATILNNPIGTAPGLAFNAAGSTLILMPGVPREMHVMLQEQVIPYLQKHFPPTSAFATAHAHFFNLGESTIDPFLRELHLRYPKIDLGIYPSHGTVTVYATCDSTQTFNGQSIAQVAIEELKQRFADQHYCAATGKLEEAVQDLFLKKGWTLSTAESCTGGAIAARLVKVAGASDYFLGGIVAYANALKETLLNVPQDTIAKYGAVSQETAAAMAKGIIAATDSDFGVAVTGVAGPSGGSIEKPVGTVCLAVFGKKERRPSCQLIQAYGNREMIIARSVNAALAELLIYCRKQVE